MNMPVRFQGGYSVSTSVITRSIDDTKGLQDFKEVQGFFEAKKDQIEALPSSVHLQYERGEFGAGDQVAITMKAKDGQDVKTKVSGKSTSLLRLFFFDEDSRKVSESFVQKAIDKARQFSETVKAQ